MTASAQGRFCEYSAGSSTSPSGNDRQHPSTNRPKPHRRPSRCYEPIDATASSTSTKYSLTSTDRVSGHGGVEFRTCRRGEFDPKYTRPVERRAGRRLSVWAGHSPYCGIEDDRDCRRQMSTFAPDPVIGACCSVAIPTGARTTQAARNLFLRHSERLSDARTQVRDRGSQFVDSFDEIFRTEGQTPRMRSCTRGSP